MLKVKHRFSEVINGILMHEGGYVNHPNDPGGETKYGISKRSYPHLDIKSLSIEEAERIYYEDWWVRYQFYKLPKPIDKKIFDLAINMGTRASVKLLQRALYLHGHPVAVDGILGPHTLISVKAIKGDKIFDLYKKICREAEDYYRSLVRRNPDLMIFLKGWVRRAYS